MNISVCGFKISVCTLKTSDKTLLGVITLGDVGHYLVFWFAINDCNIDQQFLCSGNCDFFTMFSTSISTNNFTLPSLVWNWWDEPFSLVEIPYFSGKSI